MTLFQTIFVPVCGLVAVVVLVRTVRSQILLRNGLSWTAVWLGAALLIARPGITQIIAAWLGIGRGADLILYLAILAGLLTSFYFYLRFRRMETMLTGILRREALQRPQKGRLTNS